MLFFFATVKLWPMEDYWGLEMLNSALAGFATKSEYIDIGAGSRFSGNDNGVIGVFTDVTYFSFPFIYGV